MWRVTVWLFRLWAAVVIILLVSAICSCSRVQYVPVETVRVDSVERVRLVRDSIHVRDSVTVWMQGDTVWRDRWRTVWRETARHDTVWRERRDTVAVPYPVERAATWRDRAKGWMAGVGLAAVLGVGLALLLRKTPL